MYRKRLGMSQRALAERAEFTASHLNRIEKGARKPPLLEYVLRMIEALHLTKDEAEELVELAGYSPVVLAGGQGLAYSSPPTPAGFPQGVEADLTGLFAALARLPQERQQACVDAIVTLIDTCDYAAASAESSTTRTLEDRHG